MSNNYIVSYLFVESTFEICFYIWKIREIFQTNIWNNKKSYQLATVLRIFIVKVRILQNAIKIYLEHLLATVSVAFCWLIKALNAIFV